MITASTENHLREEICRVGASLFERGYVHSTAGNISVRLAPEAGGGFLITPTDACLGFLDPANLTRLNDAGIYVSGSRPSKTFALHYCIYETSRRRALPAECVIHTHSTNCVALTLVSESIALELPPSGELLPPITPYFVMKVGHVPVIPYQYPGSPLTVNFVRACIERFAMAEITLRSVMLEKLGPVVWHQSAAQTMALLEELEETAKLYVACKSNVRGLDTAQLVELCKTFNMRW